MLLGFETECAEGLRWHCRGAEVGTSARSEAAQVGGADLAVQAIKAGLADEVRLFLVPVVVGGG